MLVLTGISVTSARGDVQSRASLCHSGQEETELGKKSHPQQRQPEKPRQGGSSMRETQSFAETLEANPSKMEKLITLLDWKTQW